MKRTIAFVISLTLSFLFFFSPIAMADQIQFQIPQVTSQSGNLGMIMAALPKVNNATFLMPIAEIGTHVLNQVNSTNTCIPVTYCTTDNNLPGRCVGGVCSPLAG